jgi:hypothetical protein
VPFRADFLAMQEIRFADDADYVVVIVDHRGGEVGMKALDVMVRDVVTVKPDAEAVRLLADHDVSVCSSSPASKQRSVALQQCDAHNLMLLQLWPRSRQKKMVNSSASRSCGLRPYAHHSLL